MVAYKDYVLEHLDKVMCGDDYSICVLITNTVDKDTDETTIQVSDMEIIDMHGDRHKYIGCLYDLDYLEEVASRVDHIWRDTEGYHAFQVTVDHIFRKGYRVTEHAVLIINLSTIQYKALTCI